MVSQNFESATPTSQNRPTSSFSASRTRSSRALAFPERDDLEPGPITWLSHSGSVFTALLHNTSGESIQMREGTW